jgi:hypothetical protein
MLYFAGMTTKILQDALRHVEAWPEAAQVELAEIALEIEAGLATGTYYATPKELEGLEGSARGPLRYRRSGQADFPETPPCMRVVYNYRGDC